MFSEKVIRLIEIATEGSFFRHSQESINLYNCIVEHYNEPLFDKIIKKLIKEPHEHSFRTIANQANKKSERKKYCHILIKNSSNDVIILILNMIIMIYILKEQ